MVWCVHVVSYLLLEIVLEAWWSWIVGGSEAHWGVEHNATGSDLRWPVVCVTCWPALVRMFYSLCGSVVLSVLSVLE